MFARIAKKDEEKYGVCEKHRNVDEEYYVFERATEHDEEY